MRAYLLSDAVRCVYDTPDTFFLAYLYQVFPRQIQARRRRDRIDDGNYSVALSLQAGIARDDVKHGVWMRSLDFLNLGFKRLHDVCVRHGKGEWNCGYRRAGWLGAVR